MTNNNSDIVFPAAARRAQAERGSAHAYEKRIAAGFPERVTPEPAALIARRAILFTVEAWDVNCSQHITARFTEAEIEEATAALRDRIAALEAENARLRAGASLAAPPEDADAHRAPA